MATVKPAGFPFSIALAHGRLATVKPAGIAFPIALAGGRLVNVKSVGVAFPIALAKREVGYRQISMASPSLQR